MLALGRLTVCFFSFLRPHTRPAEPAFTRRTEFDLPFAINRGLRLVLTKLFPCSEAYARRAFDEPGLGPANEEENGELCMLCFSLINSTRSTFEITYGVNNGDGHPFTVRGNKLVVEARSTKAFVLPFKRMLPEEVQIPERTDLGSQDFVKVTKKMPRSHLEELRVTQWFNTFVSNRLSLEWRITTYNTTGRLYIDDLAIQAAHLPSLKARPAAVWATGPRTLPLGSRQALHFTIENRADETRTFRLQVEAFQDRHNGIRQLHLAGLSLIGLTTKSVLVPARATATHQIDCILHAIGEYSIVAHAKDVEHQQSAVSRPLVVRSQ